jgi:hypothetical protein
LWRRDLPEPTSEKPAGGLNFVIKPHEEKETKAGASDRTTMPFKEVSGRGLGSWKVAIVPSGYKSMSGQGESTDLVSQNLATGMNSNGGQNQRNRTRHRHLPDSGRPHRPNSGKAHIIDARNRTEIEQLIHNESMRKNFWLIEFQTIFRVQPTNKFIIFEQYDIEIYCCSNQKFFYAKS